MTSSNARRNLMGRAFAAAVVGSTALVACVSDISSGVEYDANTLSTEPAYVVVADDARIYAAPSLDAGSIMFHPPQSATVPWRAGLTMLLVEARDGWVRVQSRSYERYPRKECAEHHERRWVAQYVAWDGWVPESALIPVFATDTRVDFEDGTWAEFSAGTMVQEDEHGQRHAVVRTRWSPTWGIPVTLERGDIATSFPARLAREREEPRWYAFDGPQIDAAWIAGVPIPAREIGGLRAPERNPAELRVGLVEVVTDCARVAIHVESVENRARVTICAGSSSFPTMGSAIPAGTSVLTTNGDVVGRLRSTRITVFEPSYRPGGLVCFPMLSLRDPGWTRLDSESALREDVACFRAADVMVDPVWPLRESFGATEPSRDDIDAIWHLMESACSTCERSMDAVAFFAERNPAATVEIAVLLELNGSMYRDQLIWALRLLGDEETAGRLVEHYKGVWDRVRRCGHDLCFPDWEGP